MVLLARPANGLLCARLPLVRKQHGLRHFSLGETYAACSNTADYIALVPTTCMESLHDLGLPWFAALPLSAVLIRSLVSYPLFQRPLRQKTVDRAHIQPLVDANMSILRRKHKNSALATMPALFKAGLSFESWRIRKRVQLYLCNRLPFPDRLFIFLTTLVASDALRRLMGAKEGLLRFVLGPLDWTVNWIFDLPQKLMGSDRKLGDTLEGVTSPASTNTNQNLVEAASLNPATDAIAGAPIQQEAPAVAEHVTSPWFDPSLTTEGFSWCPDLTAADPTFVLPIIFSSTFFASIYFAPRLAGAAALKDGERPKPTNMQRIGMTVATLSIIPAVQMPAGLLLYFITNMATNNIQSRWLAYTRPIIPAPTACKRPIRMQRSSELAEDMLAEKGTPLRR